MTGKLNLKSKRFEKINRAGFHYFYYNFVSSLESPCSIRFVSEPVRVFISIFLLFTAILIMLIKCHLFVTWTYPYFHLYLPCLIFPKLTAPELGICFD